MNIPEAVSKIKLSEEGYRYSHLYIHREAYQQFRLQVLAWEMSHSGGDLYFLGLRVVVVNDPLNVWRLA